jgi:hypothetical protein
MLVFSKFFRIYPLAISAIFLFQIGVKMAPSQVPQRAETSSTAQPISVVIRTDHGKYSLADTVKLDVSLQNTGDATAYVDRRMFWGGLAGGLKLEISDEQGKPVPSHVLHDAMMPPPKEGDTSILVRLDSGFFYGTWLDLPVKDSFPKPGRYSLRVIYKSWLRKDFVAPQLRDLPALWADSPEIASQPVWVEIQQNSASVINKPKK